MQATDATVLTALLIAGPIILNSVLDVIIKVRSFFNGKHELERLLKEVDSLKEAIERDRHKLRDELGPRIGWLEVDTAAMAAKMGHDLPPRSRSLP